MSRAHPPAPLSDLPTPLGQVTVAVADLHPGTPHAYGASSVQGLADAMPHRHQAFLAGLPWVYDDGQHVFVHAGMRATSLEPQRAALRHRTLPLRTRPPGTYHQPPQLRDKALARVSDPDWDRVVVSAHTRLGDGPVFCTPRRLSLSAEVDSTGRLHAFVLPTGPLLTVPRTGPVQLSHNPQPTRSPA